MAWLRRSGDDGQPRASVEIDDRYWPDWIEWGYREWDAYLRDWWLFGTWLREHDREGL